MKLVDFFKILLGEKLIRINMTEIVVAVIESMTENVVLQRLVGIRLIYSI